MRLACLGGIAFLGTTHGLAHTNRALLRRPEGDLRDPCDLRYRFGDSNSDIKSFSVNPLFDSDMVLTPDPTIFGRAAAGEKVRLSIPELDRSVTVATDSSSHWCLSLDDLPSGGPISLNLEASRNVTLANIFVGQVYLFVGASNIRHSLHDLAYVDDMGERVAPWQSLAREELDRANNTLVRAYIAQKHMHHRPQGSHYDHARWRVAPQALAPDGFRSFGALPYLFASQLQPRVQEAVGIVQVVAGGSQAAEWLSDQASAHLRQPEYFKHSFYNSMLAPLKGFDFTGAVIYQGESDVYTDSPLPLYRERLTSWMRQIRADAHQEEMPILLVGLAGLRQRQTTPTEHREGSPCYDVFVAREIQQQIAQNDSRCAFVSASDLGDARYIHFPDKWSLASRLVYAQQRLIQGDTGSPLSPLMSSWRKQGRDIVLTFENSEESLSAGRRHGCAGPVISIPSHEVRGLAIMDSASQWVWANASFKGNTMRVFSSMVDDPQAARYAWARNPIGNIFAFPSGLPMAPWRTDAETMAVPAQNDSRVCSKGSWVGSKAVTEEDTLAGVPLGGDPCPA